MLESLSCPGCFTRYGLRPERVHPGIRRARCFRCGAEFPADEAVHRLLAPASPAEDLAEASPTATLEGINPEDLLELDAALSAPPTHELSPDLPPAPVADSALTLGDLEGGEDEILEKTLVIEPAPEPEPGDGSSFTSAKDAIAKLLGDSPAAASAPERRPASRGNAMDVEATLDALENTLGGTPTRSLQGAQVTAPEATQTMGSTVRLSPAELQAAMSAGAGAPPPSQAPTVAIPVPSPASTRPAFPAQTEMAAPVTGDPNLLKIQVGQETYQNVTLDQLTAWIEQGRVQDWHMVARQFSDNWIEAGKVPSLRPVFERVRRMQGNPLPAPGAPPSLADTAPVKKGLFGWMSGKS